jgi:regulator of sigma E protease
MLTVVAFIVALAVLIAIHEYGHYRVAVACGVRVERFSIGFGKVLYRWKPKKQHPGQDTEFVISWLPLGGYVKMVGQGEVPPAHLKAVSFDAQSLPKRAAIVAAGPLANLLLAVLIYAAMAWVGTQQAKPIIAQPPPASLAEAAGLQAKDIITAVRYGDAAEPEPVRSMEDLRWHITQAALDRQDLQLEVQVPGSAVRSVRLPLAALEVKEADAKMYKQIGLAAPFTLPMLGEVYKGGAGEKAGLQAGDIVKTSDGAAITELGQLMDTIKLAGSTGRAQTMQWQVQRGETLLDMSVTPEVVKRGREFVGLLNVQLANRPEMTLVRYGAIEGVVHGFRKTWEISTLTLRMMGKMLIGEASIKNLSGPITIADVAGKSASLGLTQYLIFIALISVSLGVLNLLPLPVLDGGHLMYYLWEALTGKPVSTQWLERLQRGGVAVLMAMMAVAVFNDVQRLFGSFFG